MTVKLAIPGQKVDRDALATRAGPGVDKPVTDLLAAVEVVESFNLSPAAREQTKQPVEVEYQDDDVLEIEVEGGFTYWTSAKRYSEEVPLLRPDAKDGDVVTFDTLPRGSDRGVTEWVQSGLRVLRLKKDRVVEILANPDEWPTDLMDVAKELNINFAEVPAWFATKALIRIIEGRLRPAAGLYSWEEATRKLEDGAPEPTPRSAESFGDFDVDKPILVFIHGTASSARGSFGAFLSDDAQPQWQALRQLFGEHIYAFEHRTMSDSPIDNAVELVDALPRNARVSIVSHSRGGLVGDLISLRSISAHIATRIDRKDAALRQADVHDRQQLERLAGLLAEKQLRIERFVRCASPSRGTLLASENVDSLLSVLTNLIGVIPGVGGTPLYEVTKRIALEVIRNRTKPAMVPGIEAMMPGSPLVALLNNLEAPANGAMGVVSGDIEGGNWLKRIGVFATDRFIYESRDNDLVVNTDAMFNGARRDVAGYVFDQGADVSHFNYFRNPRTRAALVSWLSAPAEQSGQPPKPFLELPKAEFKPVPMLRSMQARAGTDEPIVFVLPGIMGSHLKVGDREVWMHYLALLRGGLGDLADVEAANVRPESLVGDGYRDLCESLQNTHEVIPFAYDWRRSVTQAARLLAVEVDNALRRTRQPVRIVAHSMGGLVVRAMIVERPELWDRICERDGARLVLLGTPNRGSYDIVEALLGTSSSIQQLALLDLTHDTAEIVDIVAKFPGVLELLPDQDQKCYFTASKWTEYHAQRKESAVLTDASLAEARKTRDALDPDAAVIPHADRVHYVAGTSPHTVTGVEIDDGRVVLSVTTEGDGRVTYQSGRLTGVPMWYMDAVHGDLASHPDGLPAIRELLETGTTTRLPTVPPSTARGGAVTYRALPEPVLYPTEESLAAGILGKAPRQPYRQRGPSLRVSVVHGDLRYARYPIVVGHYEGDTIVGAEAHVDGLMRGALSQRYALGLYPGEFGSVAVILRKRTAVQEALELPSGAVIIGLGKWGELSAGQLGDLLRRAALQYVLQLQDGISECAANSPDGGQDIPKVGLSILLVGGNSTANIAIGDSVGAILRAIAQVNRELAGSTGNRGSTPSVEELEIIELYADRATEAAHAAKRLAPLIGKELGTDIDAAPLLQRGREGRRRLRSTTDRDAWRRWEVSVVTPPRAAAPARLPKPLADRLKRAVLETENADAELLAALAELAIDQAAETPEVHRVIRFLTLSERARAEATSQQRQPELVERLIKDSISQTRYRQEESRVLFELTVPNELKSGLAQVDNLVLVLDAEAAAYPWELMSAGDKPLCLAKALVRQLQTSNYRPQIGARAGTAAYIVGNPLVSPPFRQLPGAEAEALAVHGLLSTKFDAGEKPLTKPTALEVLAGLYKKPYRIVHLAGHGHYEPPTTPGGKARSGMVLDNGVFLTAVEVGQMQQVPELVFLNCCHIGQTGPDAVPVPRTPAVEFNRLAASVSRELIEMGVRAVVAAGWAVRDDAAKLFAEVFYRSMLDGDTFGRALKKARDDTYTRFPDCNTWGAYQAYGDPDYRLDPTGTSAMSAPLGNVDAAEFIEAVRDIARNAENDGSVLNGSSGPALRNLKALVADCPTDWLGQTDVLMEIGYAYGRLGEFESASQYLAAALAGDGDDSTTTLRAVAELASYEAQLADHFTEAQAERTRELHKLAISRLEKLIAVAETAERFSLLGSVYKRRAVVERDSRSTKKALSESREKYLKAHELSLQRQGLDPYPALNWLALATLLGEEVPEADALIDRCKATAKEQFGVDRKFFTAIAIADAELVRALRSGRLGQDGPAGDAQVVELQTVYQEVIRDAAPNARELHSVGRHIDIIGILLGKLAPRARTTNTTVTRLADLRAKLVWDDRGTQGAGTSGDPPKPAKRTARKPKSSPKKPG